MESSSVTGVDPTSTTAHAYEVRCDKLAQDQDKANGQSLVALIKAASPAPPGPDGKGALLNVYA